MPPETLFVEGVLIWLGLCGYYAGVHADVSGDPCPVVEDSVHQPIDGTGAYQAARFRSTWLPILWGIATVAGLWLLGFERHYPVSAAVFVAAMGCVFGLALYLSRVPAVTLVYLTGLLAMVGMYWNARFGFGM